jgi:hypothetical protein
MDYLSFRHKVKRHKEMVLEGKDVGINSKLKRYIDEFMKEQYEYKSYRDVIMRDMNTE